MKNRLFGISIGLMAMGAIASATTVDCPAPPPPAQTVATVGAGVSAYSFSCGGLTFSNFQAVDAGNTTGLEINLVSATVDDAGMVLLNFNPSLNLLNQDLWFYFQVDGGVTQVDLTNGGTINTSIQETACSTAIGAGNGCTGGSAYLLGNTPLVAGGQQATVFSDVFGATSPVYIYKDISTGHTGTTHMTSFSQSFHTAVPEPMTLSMMGLGLLGLGLMRRRQAGKK